MAKEASKGSSKVKTQAPQIITFKCRLCEAQKPITEMKIITRFRPVVIVCQDCEKWIR
jgi:flavoprotein